MIDPFTYTGLPARVVFGPGRRRELPAEVERLGAKRALVISTPEQRGDAEMAAGLLNGRAAGIHDKAVMHTPMETVHEARRVADETRRRLLCHGRRRHRHRPRQGHCD